MGVTSGVQSRRTPTVDRTLTSQPPYDNAFSNMHCVQNTNAKKNVHKYLKTLKKRKKRDKNKKSL